MPTRNSPARRGRPPRLSLDAIIDVAARLIREDGVDAVSMRRVAGELDATPMALYRHVSGRDALLVAVLNRDVDTLDSPELPETPGRRVEELFLFLYNALDERPWVVDVLSRGDLYAPSVRWAIEEIIAGFVALGLTPRAAVDAYLTVWRYTVGTLIIKHRSRRQEATLDREPVQSTAMRQADAAELPLIAETSDYWPIARADFDYSAGLRAVLAGLTGS